MRRWLALGALGVVTALALTGCGGNPAGVDGDLTDDWAAIGEPTVFVPESGTCHPTHEGARGYRADYKPVDCGQPHRTETTYVGTFTGAAAGLPAPPAADSAEKQAAYRECVTKTTEFLGGNLRTARLSLAMVLPSPDAWQGGAKWFRCDVMETKSLEESIAVDRTNSLKGALSSTSPLTHRCFQRKPDSNGSFELTSVACTARHNAEFVGIWNAPGKDRSGIFKNPDPAHRACRSLIAKFARVPDDSKLHYRIGTVLYPPSASDWMAGERGVQCFLWNSTRSLTRSMKGVGTAGMPINYA